MDMSGRAVGASGRAMVESARTVVESVCTMQGAQWLRQIALGHAVVSQDAQWLHQGTQCPVSCPRRRRLYCVHGVTGRIMFTASHCVHGLAGHITSTVSRVISCRRHRGL